LPRRNQRIRFLLKLATLAVTNDRVRRDPLCRLFGSAGAAAGSASVGTAELEAL
jgi:hypothetical protein